MKQLFSIFSNDKQFDGIIGNPLANRLGLHIFRILLSDGASFFRKLPFFFLEKEARKSLAKDGVIFIEDFLGNADYCLVRNEVHQQLDELPAAPANTETGFGKKLPHDNGFDRYDGGTLNRFANIKTGSATMNCFVRNPKLSRLTLALFGLLNRSSKYYIYELRHGDESTNPDIQKQIHKDTFHHTYKLWYFVDDVTEEEGLFYYSKGSQRSTVRNLTWEYRMSRTVSASEHSNRGGSFRASAQDLQEMQNPLPSSVKIPANTLVIADTRGFHCRGMGLVGSRRISIYANFRPLAFLPIPV